MWMKLILAVGFFGIPALGLQCYNCFGDLGTDNDCEVNLQNVVEQECIPGFVCSVYITTEANISRVHRMCEGENECEAVRARSTHIISGSNRTVDYCRTCNINFCNSSISYISNSSRLSLVLVCVSFFVLRVISNKALF